MPFNLVHLSQQDPRWKNVKLGYSNDSTIGAYGCAMTSVAMLLSGFGFPETPDSLNTKLKQNNGYVQDAIVWAAVSGIYPKVRFKNLTICRDTDAPIDDIGNYIRTGQVALLEVDSSPKPGLQTHWVLAYNKVGKDFFILDPWPYPTEDGKDISLMSRYSQGKELKRSITAVVWYECLSSADTAPASAPQDGGFYVRVQDAVAAGLRIRSAASTTSDTLSIEYPGTFLKVVEAEATARPKIGVYDQWLRVRNTLGIEGYCAAWFVDAATSTSTTPSAPSAPPTDTPPQPDTGTTQPEPVPPSNQPPAPVTVNRVRPSVADGMDNILTAAPTNRRLTAAANQSGTHRLVADIWNRFGGLLGTLSSKLNIEPGAAVSVLAIESGGQAFGSDGRMIIRFENHLFYNYWGKQHTDQFNNYFAFNSTQPWTGHKFRADPKGAWLDFHGNQGREWDVFQFAAKLDETAAKLSISMGAPQIMGFNFSVIGYAAVLDMFNAFTRSDRDQVIGFFDFVQGVLPGSGALGHLRRKDFTSFATVYNGSGQAAYYSGLMKTGYDAFNSLYASLPPVSPTQPQAPTQPETPSQPQTPTEPEAPTQPEVPTTPEVPAPEPPRMAVIVSKSVGAGGLRMRKKADTVSEIIAVQPAGASLRVIEDNFDAVRARIGKINQFIWVRDYQGRRGYVAAAYVTEEIKKTLLPGAESAVSFDIMGATETAAPEPFTVQVALLAGKGGLSLRQSPTTTAATIRSLRVNTPLEVLENPVEAQFKIGRFNEWLKVREPLGAEGYVAAWFVEE